MKRSTKRHMGESARKVLSVLLAIVLAFSTITEEALAEVADVVSDVAQELVVTDGESVDETSEGAAAEESDEDAQGLDADDATSADGALGDEDDADEAADASDDNLVTAYYEEMESDELNEPLVVAGVEGEAASSEEAAVTALAEETELTASEAEEVAATIFADEVAEDDGAADADDSLPQSADGSFVDYVTVSWVTADTEDDGDDSLLTLVPSSDDDVSVRMRVRYSLSGEKDYDAGSITIKVPATVIIDRDGEETGTMVLPVPENPATNGTWNYSLVQESDGTYSYYITNTRTVSAATQGYLEFAVLDITPHEVADAAVSGTFSASIEVVTSEGTLIGATSNTITCVIDTHAEVTNATKRVSSGYPTIVSASSIPEDQQVEGEDYYVLVVYYMTPYVSTTSNQLYSLTLTDVMDGTYEGFIIDATSDDGQTKEVSLYSGSSWVKPTTANARTTTVKVAYPLSQFEQDTEYTFKNTVTYTLTEVDPAVGNDEQVVTTATATASTVFSYSDPVFVEPEGHFNVFKNGNDDSASSSSSTGFKTHKGSGENVYTYDDLTVTSNGYYGIYSSALNDLAAAEDAEISYTLLTVGYTLPWTYDGDDPTDIGNYGQRYVTMTTEDTGLTLGTPGASSSTTLVQGEDYVYSSVTFAKTPTIYYATTVNLNEDGTFTSWDDGTIDYTVDSDCANIPDVTLQVQLDGTWVDWATASWTTGELVVTMSDVAAGMGCSWDGSTTVDVPEDATSVRTTVTTNIAGMRYYVRVNVRLLGNGAMADYATSAFEKSAAPTCQVYNSTTLDVAYADTGADIVSIDKYGYDRVMGYSTDTRAVLTKEAEQDIEENDTANQLTTVHYTTTLTTYSYITDKTTYEDAIADGRVTVETSGTFYDLLPEGMHANLSTVKLEREGDSVEGVRVISDYNGSGRDLLIITCAFTPVPETYTEDGVTRYMDEVVLTFDAYYSYQSIEDFGELTHNVIAYESNNDQLGSIEGYTGENDDPYGENSYATVEAFDSDEERDIMSGLDADRGDNQSFLYAGAYQTVDYLSSGEVSLQKYVMVNSDGWWSSGLEYGDESQARDVYEGGIYAYRLSMTPEVGSKAKDIVLYDVLEGFYATDDNNEGVDTDAARWSGTLVSVDTSALEAKGCAPIVYYSTVEGLTLEAAGESAVVADEATTDLSNSDVWVKAEDYVGDLADVTAIAIDCSTCSDGSDFVLDELETAAVYVNMQAPTGEEAATYIEQDAHAYNNVYMSSTTISAETGDTQTDFIRHDYTKVGLMENSVTVTKVWDDADDQDGLRPDSVTVRLYRNGVATSQTATLEEGEDGSWTAAFRHLAYLDDDGVTISWTVHEESVPDGYVAATDYDAAGHAFTITNTHEPEQVEISGAKEWVGDTESVRPTTVRVYLYGDGVIVDSQVISAAEDGTWSYSFTADRYHDGGIEYSYEVVESTSSATSYVHTVAADGTLVNTYHPYGDLTITKTVTSATDESSEAEFEFMVVLYDSEGAPLVGEFAYATVGENGDSGNAGTISSGDVVVLRAGETLTISEIPEYASYAIYEMSADGFTLTKSSNVTGTIAPNATKAASFTNDYSASGTVSLSATKVLMGRKLTKGKFTFQVLDEDGNVVRTASNSAASASLDADGHLYAENTISFGAISYDESDAGKTYTYTIQEVQGSSDAYTYATTAYAVKVGVVDGGAGKLTCAPTYYYDANGDGELTEDEVISANDVVFRNSYEARGSLTLNAYKEIVGGSLEAEQFEFELYEVVGQEDGSYALDEASRITASNDGDGKVTFTLSFDQDDVGQTYLYGIHEVDDGDEDVTYDGHWSLVYITVGDDGNGTLSFDTSYDVQIGCFVCAGDDETCPACGGDGTITCDSGSYVFENSYADGGLAVRKIVEDTTSTEVFTFRIELTNENGESVDITTDDVTFETLIGDASAAAVMTDGTLSAASAAGLLEEDDGTISAPAATLGGAADSLVRLASGATVAEAAEVGDEAVEADAEDGAEDQTTTEADAEAAEADAEEPTAFAVYCEEDGSLTFYNRADVPSEGDTYEDKVVTAVYTGFDAEDYAYYDVPWYDVRSSILSVTVVDEGIAPISLDYWCYDFSNATDIDLSKLDVSNVTTLYQTFSGCNALTNLSIDGWDTGNVTSMYMTFYRCSSLESLDLSGWDTSSVDDMSYMFASCIKLTELDLSDWNTCSVTDMDLMFAWCYELVELDLTSWDTSAVTTMTWMFYDCSSLETIYVSKLWSIAAVTSGHDAFDGCTSLRGAYVDGDGYGYNEFDSDCFSYEYAVIATADNGGYLTYRGYTGDVAYAVVGSDGSLAFYKRAETQMPSVGDTYENAEGVEVTVLAVYTGFEARSYSYGTVPWYDYRESVTSVTVVDEGIAPLSCKYWLYDFASLESADLSKLDVSNVTDMSCLFYGCTQLAAVDVSGWDTSNVTYMTQVFCNCASLESLDLSTWDTRAVMSASVNNSNHMSYMFDGCTELSSLTLGENTIIAGISYKGASGLPTCSYGWVLLDDDGNPTSTTFSSSIAFMSGYDGTNPGTYVWNTFVTVCYHGNGSEDDDSDINGSMSTEYFNLLDEDVSENGITLKKNAFSKYLYAFDGWNTASDGTGTAYADGATIAVDDLTAGQTLELYAQWKSATTVTQVSEGVYEITIPANCVAYVSDALPAGTSYSVYELTSAGWSLVESSDTTGTISPNTTSVASFTNEYTPGETTAVVSVTKTIDGMWADADDGYEFQLTDAGGTVVDSATVADGGVVTFDVLAFTEAGTYEYTVSEVDQGDGAIDYDDTVCYVTISVADDGEGNLSAEVTYAGNGGAFANTSRPGALEIAKTVTTNSVLLADDTFSFYVTIDGVAYEGEYVLGGSARSASNGIVTMTAADAAAGATILIDGLSAGAAYAVEEVDLPDGWTLLTHTNDLSGTIEAGRTTTVALTNSYEVEGTVELVAYKRLDNGEIADGDFSFTLYDADGEVVSVSSTSARVTAETTVDSSGNEIANPAYGYGVVYFDPITYTITDPDAAQMSYTYTVVENVPDGATQTGEHTWSYAGVIYDTTPREVTVTLDVVDGSIVTSTAWENDDNVFVNELEHVTLTVEKLATNSELSEAASKTEFEFTLSLADAAGNPVTDAAGTIGDREVTVSDGDTVRLCVGEALELDLPYGTEYEVTEVEGTPGWTLVQTSETSGTLKADATVTFTNTYDASGSATVELTKKLTDADIADYEFSFVLLNEDGTRIDEATNDSAGTVTFRALDYDLDDVGKTFTYYVYEVDDEQGNIDYDDAVLSVQVSVADVGDGTLACDVSYPDGTTFTNAHYDSVPLASAGGAVRVLPALALVVMGVIALMVRRRRQVKR